MKHIKLFEDYLNESSNSKTISIKKLLKMAEEAGKYVIDAEDELEELAIAYGDKIPYSRVEFILQKYDLMQFYKNK